MKKVYKKVENKQGDYYDKKQDTVTYELKKGNEVLYVETTNDPERREQEHVDSGKQFGHMNVTFRKMTKEGAMRKEEESLSTYRQNHGGNNPKYNKDNDG